MLPSKRGSLEIIIRRVGIFKSHYLNRNVQPAINVIQPSRGKRNSNPNSSVSSLFRPVTIENNTSPSDVDVGAELTTTLTKESLMKVLNQFSQKPEIKLLAAEYGLDEYHLAQANKSFRLHCIQSESLPVDLHIIISDILQGARHVTDIFPYFLRHTKQIFPHIDCLDDLKKISDLRTPANWYPNARSMNRKIIFHAGPTNSGKTYHALERFKNAKSGVYCGPLKLLAAEVYAKCNDYGSSCDLVTGEERKFAKDENNPSNHVSCTVEMVGLTTPCEVAVIDEIQLMRDVQRGWAWTRAFLGIPANEIHICGEIAAIDLIDALAATTGETVEVRKYKRLTELIVEDSALCSLTKVQPGDCIVCFSKNDIYTVTRILEQRGVEAAVIYGSLPPGTKLAQAAKFNDKNHPCKVLVATDAIGMGLNLHIRRVIFYSLIKPTMNEKGEKEMDTISVSSALQIAGRAGRYGTQWETGYVTSFKQEDLPMLKNLLSQIPDTITQAGLHPTADQIELYAYHLPKAPLSNLMDIFVSLCTVDDSLYFMCNISDFKFLADMIQHVPLPLRARYVFCCAPINKKAPFVCSMFLKYARQYCKNEPITFNWLCQHIGWPLTAPRTLIDLVHLEAVFDVLDLYLWLSYRFVDLFPQADMVRDMQKELDDVIQNGIVELTKLLKNSETGVSSAAVTALEEENFELNTQKNQYLRDQPIQSTTSQLMRRGRLTDRLLSQGLLTPSMLQELQYEWSQKASRQQPEHPHQHPMVRRKYSRKPK